MRRSFFLLLGLVLLVSCGGERRLPPSAGTDEELARCLHLSSKKKYEEAVECLEVFKSRYPSGNRAAEANLMIGDSYFRQKEYLLAAETYQEFIRRYPFHPKLDYAYYKSGLAYLSDTPKSIAKDQQNLDMAVSNFELVFRYFPTSPYAKIAQDQYNRARAKQAAKHFYVARFYYKYSEYLASIPRFEEIVSRYSGLGFDEKSFYYLVEACMKTNQKERAREVLGQFEAQYPRSHWVAKARGKVGR